MTKIIKLDNDLDVEIELSDNQAQEISDYTEVEASINKIDSLLTKVIKPIANTYGKLNKETNIDSTKITLGVKIGIEGNFILAKSNASANIQVEMTLKPSNKN